MKIERLVRSRMARVLLACSLIGVGTWVFLPYLTHRVASSAFVNAEILRVTAPIRGRLNAELPSKGTLLTEETELTLIEAMSPDRRQLAVFEEENAVANAQIALARTQLTEIEEADSRLAERLEAHRTAVLEDLESAIGEAEARLRSCSIERDELEREHGRKGRLAERGFVADDMLGAARSAHAAAAADCDAERARLGRLRAEQAAAGDGIFMRDGNDTPYSQQQRDRLMLRRQEIQTVLLRESARARQLEIEIATERDRVSDTSRYDLVMPADHMVWAISASPGSTVVEGQTIFDLADCRRRFLSVELPERQVESIRQGDVAQIRLLGSDRWIEGVVERMRGSAAMSDGRLFAAQLPKPSERQISVDVLLPPTQAFGDGGRQCDIGRQAEVRFERGLPDVMGLVGSALAATLDSD